jgi:O-antigen/teichoic acid export membrane protein
VGYNLLGQGIPLVLALFTIPALLQGLGTHRFGILNLAWILLAWFTLFDCGLGRTLTLLTAEKLATRQTDELPQVLWTASLLLALAGLLGGAGFWVLVPWGVEKLLTLPADYRLEALEALQILTLAFPLVLLSQGLQGFLEGCQRYDLTNLGRLLAGGFTFLAPLAALQYAPRLSLVLAALVASRLATWGYLLLSALRVEPALGRRFRLDFGLVRTLWGVGGWLTVSNFSAMLILYLDRFLIGALFPMAMLAYYATPYDLVTRQLLIPNAVASVMLPALVGSLIVDRRHAGRLFLASLKHTFLLLFPLALVIVTFAPEALRWWLGAEFAARSARVLQILAIGVLVNGLAYLPCVLIQGAGRPDLTAKVLFLEFPLYALLLWLLLKAAGIEGVALAWSLRAGLDAALLLALARSYLPEDRLVTRKVILTGCVSVAVLVLAACLSQVVLKGVFLVGALTAFSLYSWHRLLSEAERQQVCRVPRQLARTLRHFC